MLHVVGATVAPRGQANQLAVAGEHAGIDTEVEAWLSGEKMGRAEDKDR